MARAYPSAGSAYTYVGHEISPPPRLRHRMEHGDGLFLQPDDLHHLVQPAGPLFAPGVALRGLGDFLRGHFHMLNMLESKPGRGPIRRSQRAWAS